MTLQELKPLIRSGKTGLIPKWKGHIKWNYVVGLMYFNNNGHILTELELRDKLKDRDDLYYII